MSPELSPARGKLRGQRARERRDRALLQLPHLREQALQRRIRIGVVVAVGADLRLLVAQLLERARQFRRIFHRFDGRQRGRRYAGVPALRQQIVDGLAVAAHLVALDLDVEEPCPGVAGVTGRRGARRPFGRQGDRAGAEALQRGLRLVEIALRRRQLVFEQLRQLSQLFALQLRGHGHVPLRDGVQDVGNQDRVRAAQLQRQKVAVQVHADIQLLAQSQRRVAGSHQRELDGAAGRETARRGDPAETEAVPYRVADRAPLELLALSGRERVRPAIIADVQPIVAGAERVVHPEGDEVPAVAGPLRREVQTLVFHDLVEHDVGAHQFHPGVGIEQRALPDRAARVGGVLAPAIRHVDPHVGLRSVHGRQHARGRDRGAQTQQQRDDHDPLEAQQCADDAVPVGAGFRALRRSVRASASNPNGGGGSRGNRTGRLIANQRKR